MIKFDLPAIQNAIQKFGFDGWLLYDFRGLNVLAQRVLGIPPDDVGSRRYFYYIPVDGDPQKLVHRIETEALDHLPGQKRIYLRWQELHEELKSMIGTATKIAMEYSPNNSNPYVSRVDGGTVELIRSLGPDVGSSGNLVQYFEARWSSEQWDLHLEADRLNQAAFEMAWSMVRDSIESGTTLRETDLQNHVMSFYAANNMTTYHPPIVAVGAHSGDPHYTPQPGSDAEIKQGDFLLLDMWAKMDVPLGVYSDVTKVGFVGDDVPDEYTKIFDIVAASRDAGIKCVQDAFAAGRELQGWEVDKASRDVIEAAGYGDDFIHRTGHNIGRETHGNGAHMDNLETKEERLVMTKTCFSIEPGIYLKSFGIRSEINVFVDGDSNVHVTGGLQTEIHKILG